MNITNLWRKPTPIPARVDFNDAMSVAMALQPLCRAHRTPFVTITGEGAVSITVYTPNYSELCGRGKTLKEACDDLMMQSAKVSALLSELQS